MKKAVLREDLMKITDDVVQAMVLGQMLFWTKTLDKVNDWLFEENKRLAEYDLPQHEYNYGWIYKSAKQMREDLMNAFSEDAIQRAFASLTKSGVLLKRNNPLCGYDRKLQYRIDLILLRRKLKEIGWEMTDFVMDSIPQDAAFIPQGAESIPLYAGAIAEIKTESKNKELPLTPSQGEEENSAMASSSTTDELPLSDHNQGATAQVGKANALFSIPPQTMKTDTLRGQRKSPHKPRQPKLVDDSFIAELKKLNPTKDVDAQVIAAKNWLLAHPPRQFTKPFFSAWINRTKETIDPNESWKPTTI